MDEVDETEERNEDEVGFEMQFVWEDLGPCVDLNLQRKELKRRKGRKYRRVKRIVEKLPERKPPTTIASFFVPGVEKIKLSRNTQKILGCVVGETVTTDYPWIRIPKDKIDYCLDIDPDSEFKDIENIENIIDEFLNEEILVIYAPNEEIEEEEFFICLTLEAEAKVSALIEQVLVEREELLKSIGAKYSRPWRSLGSDIEVQEYWNRNNRPLLEVELHTAYPILQAPSQFRLRMAGDVRDGYIDMLSYRQSFTNTIRKKLTIPIQATPVLIDISTQTLQTYPKNVILQYQYTYDIPILSKDKLKNLKVFSEQTINHVYDPIFVNSYFNFYTADYIELAKHKEIDLLFKNNPAHLVEFSSIYNHTLAKQKIISAVCWHPMWTGVVAVSYAIQSPNSSRTFRSTVDETLSAIFDVSPVLLWSFVDNLVPSLVLETPRDVTALSFCPHNEYLLVGGTIGGQIVIWDLTNRLKNVEEEVILTQTQRNYRKYMHSLVGWMKNTCDPRIIRPVVVSDLRYSHRNTIMQITWVSPYNEIKRTGKAEEIPEEEDYISLQFITIGLDGRIQVWNLGGKTLPSQTRRTRRSRRLLTLPAGLLTDESPLRPLNRVLKPLFESTVVLPNSPTPLALAISTKRNVAVSYHKKEQEKVSTSHTRARKYYLPLLHRIPNILENEFIFGSAEGDILKAFWEGFDFRSDEMVRKQVGEITYFAKFHDGIIVYIAECPQQNDIILSVGGKTFALWNLSHLNKPIMWRKSKCTYTHGHWFSFRHSVFLLCRADGCIEIWNLISRSDRFRNISVLSGGALSGLHLHQLPLEREVIGICDYTQFLRLFYIDRNKNIDYSKENGKFQHLIARELERKECLEKWSKEWTSKNAEIVYLHRQKMQETVKKKQTGKLEIKIAKEDDIEEQEKSEVSVHEAWKARQLKEMSTQFLAKQGITLEVIKEQQKPYLKIQEEQAIKQKKIEFYAEFGPNLFEDALTTLFPDAVESKSPSSDPYGGGDFIENKDSYIDNYRDIEEIYGDFVQKNKYKYDFDWLRMLKTGKERRKYLDLWKTRAAHKNRRRREKEEMYKKPEKRHEKIDVIEELDEIQETEEVEVVSESITEYE